MDDFSSPMTGLSVGWFRDLTSSMWSSGGRNPVSAEWSTAWLHWPHTGSLWLGAFWFRRWLTMSLFNVVWQHTRVLKTRLLKYASHAHRRANLPKICGAYPKICYDCIPEVFSSQDWQHWFCFIFMRNVYEKSHQSVTIRFDFISLWVVPDSPVVPDWWKCVASSVETPMSSGWQSAVDPGSHWPPYKCPERGPGEDPHLEKHEVDRAGEAGSIYKKINFTNKFSKDMELINLQSWIKKLQKSKMWHFLCKLKTSSRCTAWNTSPRCAARYCIWVVSQEWNTSLVDVWLQPTTFHTCQITYLTGGIFWFMHCCLPPMQSVPFARLSQGCFPHISGQIEPLILLLLFRDVVPLNDGNVASQCPSSRDAEHVMC